MQPAASKKRSASGEAKPPVTKKPRTWEFVDISILYNVLRNIMDGFSTNSIISSRSPTSSHDKHHMQILAAMIGLTGTDFSRSLPHLSPCKIWDAMSVKTVWFAMLRAFNYENGQLVLDDACNILISSLYKNNFSKHTHGTSLKSVLSSLQVSKLSEKTKRELPSVARIETTIKNINWLLIYWKCHSPKKAPPPQNTSEAQTADIWDHSVCFPEAVNEEYGFKRAKGVGAVQWLDS